MDIRTKDEFVFFMQRACEDTSNDCYIELYNILLRWADTKLTQKVNEILPPSETLFPRLRTTNFV